MNILEFKQKKKRAEKISMVTCYDYTSAKIFSATNIDCLLVGDSLAMTMYGYTNTVNATLEMMAMHTEAVSRGAGKKFIIGDLPFLSYRKSKNKNIEAAQTLMQAGAHAIKLEGATGNLNLIQHLVESGVPVMGHLGLTPQAINVLGGWKIQGRTHEAAQQLINDAQSLERAGCFSLVLECIPSILAKEITQLLSIPTIGIGAGSYVDGQVLVMQDLLGLTSDFKPKFVKSFSDSKNVFTQGIEDFILAIKNGDFPTDEHSY